MTWKHPLLFIALVPGFLVDCPAQPAPPALETRKLIELFRRSSDVYADENFAKAATGLYYRIPNWPKEKFAAEYAFTLSSIKSEKTEFVQASLAGILATLLKAYPEGRATTLRDWTEILSLYKILSDRGQYPITEAILVRAPEAIGEEGVLSLVAAAEHCSDLNRSHLVALALARGLTLRPVEKPIRARIAECKSLDPPNCGGRVTWAVTALAKRQSLADGWTEVLDLLIGANEPEAAEPLRTLIRAGSSWPKTDSQSQWWQASAQSTNAYRQSLFR